MDTNKPVKQKHLAVGSQLIFLTVGLLSACMGISAADDKGLQWQLIYRDNYDYLRSPQTFNTWFWREDSTATHQFQLIDIPGCSAAQPCVKLIAQASPNNTQYVNSEMYNNSCPYQSDGSIEGLKSTLWGQSLYDQIVFNCSLSYPYRWIESPKQSAPAGVEGSWITKASPAPRLDINTFAFSDFGAEAPWMAVRDTVFNNPFGRQSASAIKMNMSIKADTKSQGGSRGWGYWNTTMNPFFMQLAWFMEYSEPKADGRDNRIVLAQSIGKNQSGHLVFCQTPLADPDLIYSDFHDYSITLVSQSLSEQQAVSAVLYAVDGKTVATHLVNVDRPMAFHNWVDNRNYRASGKGTAQAPDNFPLTEDKSNLIRSFSVEQLDKMPGLTQPQADGKCSDLSKLGVKTLQHLLTYAYAQSTSAQ